VMAGHYSARALAVVGLGTSVYFSIFVSLMGVLLALTPVLSRLHGAHDAAGVTEQTRQGIWLSLACCVPAIALLAFPDPLLAAARMDASLEADVRAYLRALTWAVPAMLGFRVFYCFATAISSPKAVMVIQLVGLAIKVPLNYVLMYGKFGLPELGGVGCAWALVIEAWLMLIGALLWVRFHTTFHQYGLFKRLSPIHWASQLELVKLGAPIGGAFLIDVTSYTFMALFIARLGENTSAAHQIAANLGALGYMVPLALSNAASVLVGQAIGAGKLAEARTLGWAGIRIGMVAALLVGAGYFLLRAPIAAAYAKDAAVVGLAIPLIAVMALYHVFDATNAMVSNVARAYKKALVPMLAFALALWIVGLGGGYWLAYGFQNAPSLITPLGAVGFWWGAAIGMALAAGLVMAYTARVMRQAMNAPTA
jgi:multidrug resistance protein, MATE family